MNSPPSYHVDEGLRLRLQRAVRGDCYFDDVIRGVYSCDASLFQVIPAAVVVAADAGDVIATMRLAAQVRLPVTVRGGGTSLSGQTFGPGIVVDISKGLCGVRKIDVQQRLVRVEAGVVRDRLNAQLAAHRLHFAPDPATGSRATIGGMIGNNTCGTRSVAYGKTIDHVIACRTLLADGTVCEFEDRPSDYWRDDRESDALISDEAAAGRRRERQLLQGLERIVAPHADLIRQRYPRVLRRVSGYNLDEFVDGAGYTGSIGPRADRNAGHRPWNLSNLMVGSEGTLGIVLEATLRLTPLPAATALCVVHFHDVVESLAAIDTMLEHPVTAIELLDKTVITEAIVNPATREMATFFEGDPQAVMIVEFQGVDLDAAACAAQAFADAMAARAIGYSRPVIVDAKAITDVWETRKLGLGLISNVPGPVKGRDFIEDACVPTQHLADYVRRIYALCHRHGIDRVSVYAHASVGVVHIVPALDLHDQQAVQTMQAIADQAFAWVMELGGSWSGEHGDGQLRGQYLPQMFGDEIYEDFRQVKRLFDPHNLLNPGKVIDTARLDENLRYQTPGYTEAADRSRRAANYRYADQGGLPMAIEQCNGVGACRKVGSGTMCPSFMATGDEQHSTRGRANALRLAMSGQLGRDPVEMLASDGVHDVLELCLACKACKSECPNRVDMAKMKSDVLQMRHDRLGTPLAAKLLGRMPDAAAKLAGTARGTAALATAWLGSSGLSRRLLAKLTRIDPRRPLPAFAPRTLSQLLAESPIRPGSRSRGRVVLFDDTYANYFEPQLGYAALRLLEEAGFEAIRAEGGCCQRTRLSQGLVHEAKQRGAATIRNLDHFARQGIPIVCLEPSCASALVDDLTDLVDDRDAAARVAGAVTMLDIFLHNRNVPLTPISRQPVMLHGHCHQKALFQTSSIEHFFAAAGVSCQAIDAGCCGMAGAFGYQHYDLSQKIGEQRLFPAARQAVADGRQIVACGISCRHQLADCCGITARHWVECFQGNESAAGRAD